ncbi:MAG: hypothetical protein IKX00_00720 [Bacilli bacterium]|nr:hypothetical protein [Bacilli bacterium]
MKILKGIGIFFLSLFAFIFVFLISLSLIFRNVIQKGVVGSVVKNIMIEEFSKVKKLTAEDKENIEKVNKVIKTDDINKLVDKLIDEYELSLDNENYKVSDKTVDYIVDLLVEYKDLINDITQENVTEKEIRSTEVREGIIEGFDNVLGDEPEGNMQAIKIGITSYNFFTSNTFRILAIFLTILCFALIALIKKSYYKWVKSASKVFVMVGLLISASYFAIIYAFKEINNSTNYGIVIDPKYILILGITEILIGIVFLIVHIILHKDNEE